MNQSGYLLLEQSDFLSNYVGGFQQLRGDKDLFDVTLACEDETIDAHKVVLSACSIFFRNVFKKAKQKHPFIYHISTCSQLCFIGQRIWILIKALKGQKFCKLKSKRGSVYYFDFFPNSNCLIIEFTKRTILNKNKLWS